MERKFRVSWMLDGIKTVQPFNSKAEAKHYIEGLKLMGITDPLKEYYSPVIGDWYSYHSDKE